MSAGIRSDAGGTFAALQFNGADSVLFDANGLRSAPNKSVAASSGPGGSQLAGFRNKIINGSFNVWQRGTSLAASTGIRYLADRWRTTSIGTTIAPSRQSFILGQPDVPYEPVFFHRCVVASVAGANNFANFAQAIESVRTFAGQTATVSFWARADAPKNIAIEFTQHFGTGGSPSTEVTGIGVSTIALTTAWKKFSITVTFPSIAGKTLGTGGNDFVGIHAWMDAGSTYNARTNSLGQQSGIFDFAQFQFEPGDVATPLEQRTFDIELFLSQRFYEKTFRYEDPPLNNLTPQSSLLCIVESSTTNFFGQPWVNWFMKVPKRAIPTVTLYSPAGGAIAQWFGGAGGVNSANANILDASEKTVLISNSDIGTSTPNAWRIHAAADAELG